MNNLIALFYNSINLVRRNPLMNLNKGELSHKKISVLKMSQELSMKGTNRKLYSIKLGIKKYWKLRSSKMKKVTLPRSKEIR
jgi:hypothetical protein